MSNFISKLRRGRFACTSQTLRLEALENRTLLSFTGSLYPAGAARDVAVGDFNGDGRQDVVTANLTSMSVFLANPDGTFAPKVNYTTLAGYVAVRDFNRDFVLDVVTTGGGMLHVLLGNGDGTFQPPVSYAAGSSPFQPVVADFNKDGAPDVAVGNSGGNVSILQNKGDGSFLPPKTFSSKLTNVFHLLAGDFDNDGDFDLIASNSSQLSVLKNTGTGRFRSPGPLSAPPYSMDLAAGDFDADGDLDLAVAGGFVRYGSHYYCYEDDLKVTILIGKGNGTFQAGPSYFAGAPAAVATGDFDKDGDLDLAVGSFYDDCEQDFTKDSLRVLLGNGNGTFNGQADYLTGYGWVALAVGDFNGDSFLDVAATGLNDSSGSDIRLGILINNADWPPEPIPPYDRLGNEPVDAAFDAHHAGTTYHSVVDSLRLSIDLSQSIDETPPELAMRNRLLVRDFQRAAWWDWYSVDLDFWI